MHSLHSRSLHIDGQVTPFALDIARRWRRAIRAKTPAVLEERRCQRSRSSVREDGPTTEVPGLLGASTDELGQGPDLGAGKETDETLRLLRPSATHLCSPKRQVWRAHGFLRVLGTSFPCGGVLLARRHHRRWHTAGVALRQRAEERPERSRGTRATPPRPLQGGDRQRLGEEPSPRPTRRQWRRREPQLHGRCVPQRTQGRIRVFQAPRSRARCTVVAKDVERTATPASTRRKRKRKSKTAQEKNAEEQRGEWKW